MSVNKFHILKIQKPFRSKIVLCPAVITQKLGWKFVERKRGMTLVSVEIDFELSPGLASFEPIMSEFSHRYVTAFKDQAEKMEKFHRKT